jgi:hypothetical protein
MTKENIYKTYLEDPLLLEKSYIAPENIDNLTFSESTNVKLLEVIKLAITGNVDGESEGIITRKINLYLNK